MRSIFELKNGRNAIFKWRSAEKPAETPVFGGFSTLKNAIRLKKQKVLNFLALRCFGVENDAVFRRKLTFRSLSAQNVSFLRKFYRVRSRTTFTNDARDIAIEVVVTRATARCRSATSKNQ